MEKISPEGFPYQFRDQEQQVLRDWLNSVSSSLAELYEGALFMLNSNTRIPGYTRFIAHAVREVINNVERYFVGGSFDYLRYSERIGDISKIWDKMALPTKVDENCPPEISLPRVVFQKVAELLEDHRKTSRGCEEKIAILFSSLVSENQSHLDQLRPVMGRWKELADRFVGYAHNSKHRDEELDTKVRKDFELFERTLGSLVRLHRGEFLEIAGEIDEILEEANS